MILNDNKEFPFYTFSNLGRYPTIKHFVTSSAGESCADVNLRSTGGVANRRRLAKAVGFDIDLLTTPEQTHSNNIGIVTTCNMGCGAIDIDSRIPNTDALITNVPNVCIMILTADCVPILLYDPNKQAVAAIHAGWRGSANGIVAKTVEQMTICYGTNPSDIIAAIGPCIGKCCFEVGDEVVEQFAHQPSTIISVPHSAKKHIDIQLSNKLWLLDSGVSESNIELANCCTKCSGGEFFSHRHNQTLGRIGSGIVLDTRVDGH